MQKFNASILFVLLKCALTVTFSSAYPIIKNNIIILYYDCDFIVANPLSALCFHFDSGTHTCFRCFVLLVFHITL